MCVCVCVCVVFVCLCVCVCVWLCMRVEGGVLLNQISPCFKQCDGCDSGVFGVWQATRSVHMCWSRPAASRST